jgi:hypothetical protein
MAKIKSMPKAGWFVAGLAVALLLIPTAAGAKAALKFTGIEGTSGSQADVTKAGQLQVAAASPSSLYQNGYFANAGGDTFSTVAQPPAGDALIVDHVHIVVEEVPTTGVPMYLTVRTGTNCATGSMVPGLNQPLFAAALGVTDDPLTPGALVPSGDSLCLQVYGTANTVDVVGTASGYTIPAADAS